MSEKIVKTEQAQQTMQTKDKTKDEQKVLLKNVTLNKKY